MKSPKCPLFKFKVKIERPNLSQENTLLCRNLFIVKIIKKILNFKNNFTK